MANIDPHYLGTLSSALVSTFSSVETAKGAAIPARVRSLAEAVILESVTLRTTEWKTRNIDCNDPAQLLQTVPVATDALQLILTAAAPEQVGPVKEVTLAEFLKQSHQQWCGIFPFCRQ